jgi:hypothetical protein
MGSKNTKKLGARDPKIKPQNTVYSAASMRFASPNGQVNGESSSLSSLMAMEGDIYSKNPKTLSLSKLLDEEIWKVTLLKTRKQEKQNGKMAKMAKMVYFKMAK